MTQHLKSEAVPRSSLPPAAQRWLDRALPPTAALSGSALLEQEGTMDLRNRWTRFKAAGLYHAPPLSFSWQAITSLSPPVTYRLQIATDPNFSSPVLEKTGLTAPEYTLLEEEALPDVKQAAPYYWRVKATDGAGNASEWSTPQAFYTSSAFAMPAWALYTVIAVIIIVVAYLAFRVGKHIALRPPE